jgi:Electron transfer DM13
MVMIGAAQVNNTINENTSAQVGAGAVIQRQPSQDNATCTVSTIIRTGSFIGASDGFHNAEGLAKVIQLGDGSSILRLENFKSTNGPNVHLYLSTDKAACNFIDLGRLKANNGNQNICWNWNKYDMALICCKDFSVLFGSAQLKI